MAYPSQAPRFAAVTAAIVAMSLVGLAINRRGAFRAVGWLVAAAIWAVAVLSAWTAGGTVNTGLSAVITLVAVGGVMLGWRAGLVLAVAGVATVVVEAVAQTQGWLPEPAFTQTAWIRAIWLADFVAITAGAMVVFARELTGARDRAVSELAKAARDEEAIRAVMDYAPFGAHLYHLEDDGRLVFVGYNRKAAQMLAIDHDELLGLTVEEAFPGNAGREGPEVFRRVARDGGALDLEQYAYESGDVTGIFELHAVGFGPDSVAVFFRDVTEKRKAELALLKADEMLAVAQEAASAGFWSWDIPSGELTWTPQFYRLFGLPEDAPATFDTWRAALHPDDVEAAGARIEKAVEDRIPLDNEYRIVLPDGVVRWIGAKGTATYGEDGEPLRMAGICIDISEKHQREEEIRALNAELEERVEERTRELSFANRELEQFVYSASHDLRSPLRALDGFSQVLLEDCGDVLSGADVDHLHRIRAASQHMAELIDALLALSRVGRREVDLRMVDLTEVASAIVDELREAEPQRVVTVSIAPELQARTDEALADIVLRNLLSNAWKFTSRQEEATIEVGLLRVRGTVAYYVRDDGAGFDQDYVRSIFRPFQRLHDQEEFPGTGIGLATVQRALDKLKGTCWAEGKPGEGATFFFTLG